MNLISEHLDPEDWRKAKRALLLASITTLVVAGVEIISDEFALFGFEVRLAQDKLVASGQIVSGVLLFLYCIKIGPDVVRRIQDFFVERLKAKHANEDEAQKWDLGFGDDEREYNGSVQDEIDDQTKRQKHERLKLNRKYSLLNKAASLLVSLVQDFSIPLAIGAMAAFYPHSLDQIIEKKLSKEQIPELIWQKADAIIQTPDRGSKTTPQPLRWSD